MPAPAHGVRRAAALTLGVAYAVGAAMATPFSWQADLLTALPIGALAVAVFVRWPLHPRAGVELTARGTQHPYAPWVALLAAVVAWELVQYASAGSRALHPTLSSMTDAVDRYVLLKAVVLFGWLCLGAAIVHAGVPRRSVSAARGTDTGDEA